MKLVSMKRTPKDKKEETKKWEGGISTVDDYGYNTRISLGPEECKKLGISATSPLLVPGTKITISAEGYIKSGNVEFGDKDGDSPRIEIQITDLGVEEDADARKEKTRASHLASIGKVTKE